MVKVLINISEGVVFICKEAVYFFISYIMSFAKVENGFCQSINADTEDSGKNKI